MTPTAALPRTTGRKRIIRIAGSLLLLVVLVLVFPRHKLLQALASIPPSTIAAALPIYVSLHFLGSLKWQLMVNRPDAPLTFLESVRCYFGGLFSNLFLPSVIGGDVVTIALGVSETRKTEQLVSGTLANRIIDLAALALLVGSAVFVFPLPNRDRQGVGAFADVSTAPEGAGQQLIQLVLIVLISVSIIACLSLFLLRRKISGRAAKYVEAFIAAWRKPWLTLVVLALSLAMQTGLIALSAWIGVGCGLHLPARAWLFAWPLAKLSGFVPVTLAGIGSRELVLPALLAPFGADPAAAASVGLAWDAVLITGSLVGGAISKIASLARAK